MVDRTKAPAYKIIENIHLPQISHIVLDNDIAFHLIHNGINDVVQLTISFRGGTWFQKKTLVALTTLKMLKHGTKNKTSEQISQLLNFYAVGYKTTNSEHSCRINFHLLKKHLEPVLQLLHEILTRPTFPEDELKIYLENSKQEYLIELEEVEIVARNLFMSSIFGYHHPYGLYALPEDFDKITQNDVKEYHQNVFVQQNMTITGAGNFTDKDIKLINKYLCNINSGSKLEFEDIPIKPAKEKYIFQPKDESLQSAIMLGNRTIERDHPDFHKLSFVVYALGGYFSSRLMTNIREQKGLTYGITAYTETFIKASYIAIEAAVKKQNKDLVLEEIRKEIKKLKSDGLSDSELKTSKNLLLSDILKLIDGSYAFARYLSILYSLQKDENYIYEIIKAIKDIDNKTVIDLANKYLCFDDFYKVIVG